MDTYEKKYNEALKWMRELYPGLHGATKEDAEHYFPELRESEDERIRKELLSFIESVQHSYLCATDRREKWIAYLEKQKYDRMKPVYDNQDSFESALEKAWKDYNDSGARTVDGCEDDYVECAHAKGFREGYLFGIEKQKEQKPAEWSEEDEKMLTDISWAIRHCAYDDKKKERVMKWFNDDYRKSLRPSWKPSEEQMEALAYAIQILDDGLSPKAAKAGEELESIREHFKKL